VAARGGRAEVPAPRQAVRDVEDLHLDRAGLTRLKAGRAAARNGLGEISRRSPWTAPPCPNDTVVPAEIRNSERIRTIVYGFQVETA